MMMLHAGFCVYFYLPHIIPYIFRWLLGFSEPLHIEILNAISFFFLKQCL